MLLFACLFAFVWGTLLALFLQLTHVGRWLVVHRTWITVVIGVGIDLLLLLAFVPPSLWWCIALVFVASGVPLIIRSLINELADDEELINGDA